MTEQQDQEPSRPLRVLSMAVSLFIVASALIWLSREDGPPPPKPVKRERREEPKLPPREPAERGEPTEPRERMDATARAAALNALPPLPLPETKLAEQLAVLRDRAQSGDPQAGCRLVIAGARCRQSVSSREFSALMQESMERRRQANEDLLVTLVAERREQYDGFCDGLAKTDLPSTNAVLQRTQPWMTPRQKVLVAMMRSDGLIVRLNASVNLSESGEYVYPQYLADHAYEFLLEGFRAYDPLALEGLALIHSPSGSGWGGTGPSMPNPRLYAFYIGLLERLYGPASVGRHSPVAARARATLPPAQRDRLDRQIDREARQWLEAVPPETMSARWQALQREDLRLEHCEP